MHSPYALFKLCHIFLFNHSRCNASNYLDPNFVGTGKVNVIEGERQMVSSLNEQVAHTIIVSAVCV